MPLSNPVIRRYTPPTCTLEVVAQSSPLSRWMGKSVLKQVRFHLSFDDPRQPEEEKVLVQGDRDQLEILHTAVSGYVQEILQQSPENFWASRTEAHSSKTISKSAQIENISNLEQDISDPRNEFARRGDIYLKPSSNLNHQLFLGSLASPVSGSSIQLGLLQLFDLATALDDYTADVVALPANMQSQSSGNRFSLPTWAPVAAVMLLGLGLMPFTYQYANRMREKSQADKIATKTGVESSSNISTTPSLTPLSTPNSLLTPSPNLSPLPTLGSGVTIPDISAPVPGASPNPTLAATQKPSASQNPSSGLSNIPLPPLGSNNFGVSTAKKPQTGGNTLSISPNSLSSKTSSGQTGLKPKVGGNISALNPKSKISIPSTSLPSATLPSLTNPSTPKAPLITSKQATPSPQSPNNQGNLLTNPPKSSSNLAAQLRGNRTASPANNGGKSNATTAAATSETLFDNNQVAEVRSYLRQRWNPPSGLTQPLEYSMTVGVDGALEQLLPLGKAARDYVENAGIPKIGQPFISSSRNGQNIKVRAVLSPNGKVQVFPEKD